MLLIIANNDKREGRSLKKRIVGFIFDSWFLEKNISYSKIKIIYDLN